jgi:oligopeptide/dipeptide ABC transporter ATP-binding protein
VEQIFPAPQHPYTRGLLDSLPSQRVRPGEPLHVISGRVPDLAARPKGCSFRERCGRALERCAVDDPALRPGSGGSAVACHNPVPPPGART